MQSHTVLVIRLHGQTQVGHQNWANQILHQIDLVEGEGACVCVWRRGASFNSVHKPPVVLYNTMTLKMLAKLAHCEFRNQTRCDSNKVLYPRRGPPHFRSWAFTLTSLSWIDILLFCDITHKILEPLVSHQALTHHPARVWLPKLTTEVWHDTCNWPLASGRLQPQSISGTYIMQGRSQSWQCNAPGHLEGWSDPPTC